MTTVVIPVYDRFTALDVAGPYQMLALTPGVTVHLAAERPGELTDDCGSLTVRAVGLDEVARPDVLVVPGGPGTLAALSSRLPTWIAEVHRDTTWTTSVCSGSLLLGAAGVLHGRRATTHYRHLDKLAGFGAVPVEERVVEEPAARVITAAGVSSGIDMGLRLVELIRDRRTAEAIQLWTEYDPRPPFDAGSPKKAGAGVRALAAEYEAAALEAARSAR